LFSGLDDCGLLLRNLLNISLPSVCSIFRNSPSVTLQHCGREEGRRRKSDSNLADAIFLEGCLPLPHYWVTAISAAGVAWNILSFVIN
jgi:hypothetical protein